MAGAVRRDRPRIVRAGARRRVQRQGGAHCRESAAGGVLPARPAVAADRGVKVALRVGLRDGRYF